MALWPGIERAGADLPYKPWNDADVPEEVLAPVGMIGPEERRCFWWLARNWFTGAGSIVDAGSFVGASTFCFASGAAAAGYTQIGGGPVLHAYDYFAAIDNYVAEAISKKFRPMEIGGSYLDIFQSQTAKYAKSIEAHPGNFLEHRWTQGPIEILFIDIAKSWKLNAHVIGEFFPSLIPGQSTVVHQDYYHCWHPYIHIGMEFLADSFELVDEHVEHQSRVWRLAKALPEEKIARLRAHDLDAAERIMLLDRLVENSSPDMRPMMEVVRLWQRCLDRDFAGAKRDLAQLRYEYDIENYDDLWCRQALMIEERRRENLAAALNGVS